MARRLALTVALATALTTGFLISAPAPSTAAPPAPPSPTVITFEDLDPGGADGGNTGVIVDHYEAQGVHIHGAYEGTPASLQAHSGAIVIWDGYADPDLNLGVSFDSPQTMVGAWVSTWGTSAQVTCTDSDGTPYTTSQAAGLTPSFISVSAPGLVSCEFGSDASTGSWVVDDLTFSANAAPSLSATDQTATVGSAFSYTPQVGGSPAPVVNVRTGARFDALPVGLSLDKDTGTISGTPAAGTTGKYLIGLRAVNGVGTEAFTEFELTVDEAPSLGATDQTAKVGSAFSYTPSLSGSPAPTVNVRTGSRFDALPAGLSIDKDTGTISGTPDTGTGGVYLIGLRAVNGVSPQALAEFQLTVDEAPSLSATDQTATVGTAFSYTPAVGGYPAARVNVRAADRFDALPAGLSIDKSTGTISGTPEPGAGGIYRIGLRAVNGVDPNALADFDLTVSEAPAISGPAMARGQANHFLDYTLDVLTGYPAPTVTLTAGTLPTGLTLDADTGEISGTPATTVHGTFPITLTAANGVDPAATLAVTIKIRKDDITGLAPYITGRAQVGQTLTANPGDHLDPADSTLQYVWTANRRVIPGATGATLYVDPSLAGKHIRVEITARHRDYRKAVATSPRTPYVRELVDKPRVKLDDNAACVGQTVRVVGQGLVPGNAYVISAYGQKIHRTADQYGEVKARVDVPKFGLQLVQVTSAPGTRPRISAGSLLMVGCRVATR